MSENQTLPVDPEITSALGEFTKQLTVPILFDAPERIDQVGTGTLFVIGGRFFLITASHLFDDAHPENFTIPSNPIRDPDPTTLGRFQLIKPKQDFVDIAAIELLEPDTIRKIQSGWRLLTLENIACPTITGVFALCGYPSERAKRIGTKLIGGSLVTTYTERMRNAPAYAEAPVHSDLDLFFHYDVEATGPDGTKYKTPHLGGTSGASVWEYRDPVNAHVWTPEAAFKIVGVQSAFRKGEYFRAKSWTYVLQMLCQADDHMAGVVDQFRKSLPT